MIKEAYISGQLGKAIYRKDSSYYILDVDNINEPTECFPFDFSLFFGFGVEYSIYSASDINLDEVKRTLENSSKVHDALHLTINGLNSELSEDTRSTSIEAAEEIFQDDNTALSFVANRMLVRITPEIADLDTAIRLTDKVMATRLNSLYKEISEVQDNLKDLLKVWEDVSSGYTTTSDKKTEVENILIEKGIFAEMIRAVANKSYKNFNLLVFEAAKVVELKGKIPEVVLMLNKIKAHYSNSLIDSQR